jgi:hypothetical protein
MLLALAPPRLQRATERSIYIGRYRALTGSPPPPPRHSWSSRHLCCCTFWCLRGIPAARHHPWWRGSSRNGQLRALGGGQGLPGVQGNSGVPLPLWSLVIGAYAQRISSEFHSAAHALPGAGRRGGRPETRNGAAFLGVTAAFHSRSSYWRICTPSGSLLGSTAQPRQGGGRTAASVRAAALAHAGLEPKFGYAPNLSPVLVPLSRGTGPPPALPTSEVRRSSVLQTHREKSRSDMEKSA